jgi:hypothetical protein
VIARDRQPGGLERRRRVFGTTARGAAEYFGDSEVAAMIEARL